MEKKEYLPAEEHHPLIRGKGNVSVLCFQAFITSLLVLITHNTTLRKETRVKTSMRLISCLFGLLWPDVAPATDSEGVTCREVSAPLLHPKAFWCLVITTLVLNPLRSPCVWLALSEAQSQVLAHSSMLRLESREMHSIQGMVLLETGGIIFRDIVLKGGRLFLGNHCL